MTLCARVQDVLAAGGVVGGGKPVQGVSDAGATGPSGGGAAGLATKAASAVNAAQADMSGSFQLSALVRAAPMRLAACINLYPAARALCKEPHAARSQYASYSPAGNHPCRYLCAACSQYAH